MNSSAADNQSADANPESARPRSGRWLRAGLLLALLAAVAAMGVALKLNRGAARAQFLALVRKAREANEQGDHAKALLWALAGLTEKRKHRGLQRNELHRELLRAYGRNRLLHVLEGHSFGISRVSFAPDGKSLLTASGDRTVKIWDAQTGKLRRTLSGDFMPLQNAQFHPVDGRAILIPAYDKVYFLDPETGRIRMVLENKGSPIADAGYSPDGTRVVTTSFYGPARLWDAESGGLLHTFRIPRDDGEGDIDITAAAFSPDGSRVLTATEGASAQIWDVATGELLHNLSGHNDRLTAALFGPSGRLVAAAGWSGTALLWDAQTGRRLCALEGHGGMVEAVAFSPAGDLVATIAEDDLARLWNTATCRPARSFAGRKGGEPPARFGVGHRRVEFSPDGRSLLASVSGRRALLWDVKTGERIDLGGHDNEVADVDFSPDGARVVTASADGTARIWTVRLPDLVATLRGHDESQRVSPPTFSPDGRYLATASDDGTARLWGGRTGKLKHVLTGHEDEVVHAAFDGAGARLVTSSVDGTARLWNVKTGSMLTVMKDGENGLHRAILNQDGTRALTYSRGNSVSLWETETGRRLTTFRPPDSQFPGGILGIALSPAGPRVLAADRSNSTVSLWDVESGDRLLSVEDTDSFSASGVFSRGGTHLITSVTRLKGEATARIWEAASGKPVMTLISENFWTFPHFDWAERRLISAHFSEVWIWNLKTGKRQRKLNRDAGTVTSAMPLGGGTGRELLFTSSLWGPALLWDMHSGRALRDYSETMSRTLFGAASSDGARIVLVTEDNRIRLWAVAPIYRAGLEEQVQMACAMAARTGVDSFSEDEMQELVLRDRDASPCGDGRQGSSRGGGQ